MWRISSVTMRARNRFQLPARMARQTRIGLREKFCAAPAGQRRINKAGTHVRMRLITPPWWFFYAISGRNYPRLRACIQSKHYAGAGVERSEAHLDTRRQHHYSAVQFDPTIQHPLPLESLHAHRKCIQAVHRHLRRGIQAAGATGGKIVEFMTLPEAQGALVAGPIVTASTARSSTATYRFNEAAFTAAASTPRSHRKASSGCIPRRFPACGSKQFMAPYGDEA